MNLTSLPQITKRRLKRVGRGIGSGKGGHTTGRGQKGQKARERVPQSFEGSKWKKSFLKQLPALRGEQKFKPWGQKYTAIAVEQLLEWPEKTGVTLENLIKAGVLRSGEKGKLVGTATLKHGLQVSIPVSASAKKAIETAGGTIETHK